MCVAVVAFDSFDCLVIECDWTVVMDEVETVNLQNTAATAAVAAAAAVVVVGVCGGLGQGRCTVQVTHCSLSLTVTVIEENSWIEIPCVRMILHSSRGVHVSCAASLKLLVPLYENSQKRNVYYVVTL